MSESLTEKIKQAFVEDTCIVYGKRQHWRYDGPDYARTRCESIIELYEEKTIPAIQEKVLKILEDYHLIHKAWKDTEQILDVLGFKDKFVVEKQKLNELTDLLKTRPRKNQFKPTKPSADSLVWGYGYIDKLEEYLKVFEKKLLEVFSEPAKKEQ